MRILLGLALALALACPVAWGQAKEYIVLSGGPALRKWEKSKERTHDVFWGNFVESALVRIGELKAKAGPGDQIAWLVFKPGYVSRSREERQELTSVVQQKANAIGVALFWFDTTDQVINYINRGKDRTQLAVGSLDYFGHSNKVNWMFDYSNDIDGCSTIFLHTRDLSQLQAAAFAPDAEAKSWGCHSGEYYSQKFFDLTGVKMWGAVGKTDYSRGGLPFVSTEGGRWTQ